MFAKIKAAARRNAKALREYRLTGKWQVLFCALGCIQTGVLTFVGMNVSDSIDNFFAAHSEAFPRPFAVRSVAQLALMLFFIAIAYFLLAVIALLVARLRDSKFTAAKEPPGGDFY